MGDQSILHPLVFPAGLEPATPRSSPMRSHCATETFTVPHDGLET